MSMSPAPALSEPICCGIQNLAFKFTMFSWASAQSPLTGKPRRNFIRHCVLLLSDTGGPRQRSCQPDRRSWVRSDNAGSLGKRPQGPGEPEQQAASPRLCAECGNPITGGRVVISSDGSWTHDICQDLLGWLISGVIEVELKKGPKIPHPGVFYPEKQGGAGER